MIAPSAAQHRLQGSDLRRVDRRRGFLRRPPVSTPVPSLVRPLSGTRSSANLPAWVAATARWWLRTAKASSSARSKPYSLTTSSIDRP